jgi:hypothetical protein
MKKIRLLQLLAVLAAATPLAACGDILRSSCVPVEGTANPAAPRIVVTYRSGVPAEPTTTNLAAKYGFTPAHVYESPAGFATEVSQSALVGLQCESVVESIEHDVLVSTG